jgi:hypothetical protein
MRTFFSSLFILIFIGVRAQSVNSNVLSYYGLGERAIGNHSIYDALGTNNFNLLDSTQLNFFNPASYSLMSAGNTLLSVGIYGRTSQYTFNDITEYQFSAMPDHFALGFKMRKRMGMSFGLKPFSNRGYSFSQRLFTGTDSIKYEYAGKGGIQDLFLGFSYGLIQKNSTKLSLGLNASYLFGKVTNEKQSILIDGNTFSGGVGRHSINIKSFHYEFGLMVRQKLGKRQEVTLSAVYAPGQSLNGTSTRELYTAANINTLSTYDTLDFNQVDGQVNLGIESKYGLAYQFSFPDWKRKTRALHPQLTVLASYTSINAGTYDFENSISFENSNASKIGIGLQFKPEAKLYENISTLKFFEKLTYRFGAYSSQLPYVTSSGSQYLEQAFTVGFGMPILAQQGLSSLNLSIGFGNRGVSEPSFTTEQFITFNFGLVISPSNFDRWFRKRKLD